VFSKVGTDGSLSARCVGGLTVLSLVSIVCFIL
jgi:hypothetical protein